MSPSAEPGSGGTGPSPHPRRGNHTAGDSRLPPSPPARGAVPALLVVAPLHREGRIAYRDKNGPRQGSSHFPINRHYRTCRLCHLCTPGLVAIGYNYLLWPRARLVNHSSPNLQSWRVLETQGLVEVTHHENEIRVLIQFDEPSPVLVVNPKGVKPFVVAFERLKV
jgi:hypothetical protein